jgi:hypothetical protein
MPSKHLITLAEATAMTKNYRNMRENILDNSFRNKNILPLCETFDRDAFDAILAQNGCTGVRLYVGMDDNDLVKMIAVGVNAQDQDILATTDPVIMEVGSRCPPQCPVSSTLNS